MCKKIILLILALSIVLSSQCMILFTEAENSDFYYAIEAEDTILQGNYFVLEDDPQALGGKYINALGSAVPEPTTVKDFGIGIKVNAPKKEVYSVWARIRANYSVENEIYVYDYCAYRPFTIPNTMLKAWNWMKVNMVVLEEGENIVKFAFKEPNVRIDKFIITDDLYFIPKDKGDFPVYEAGKKPLFYNLPIGAPEKGVHPRVMVTEADLPKIISNLTHEENIEMYKEVQTISKRDYDGILPAVVAGRTTNEDYKTAGTAEACAFLYLIEKDKEMGQKAINIMKNYITTIDYKTEGDAVTRHYGYAMYISSCVYDWCYDLLTEEDKVTFRTHLLRLASRMEIAWPPIDQHNVTGHGTEMQTYRDALAMGIALYDEDPEIYNMIAGRIFQEMLPAENYALSGRLAIEGNAYGPFRGKMKIMSTWLFDKIGLKNVYTKDQAYMIYGLTMYDRMPDGRFFLSGDCGNSSSTGFFGDASDLCFLAGNYYKDPYIRKMYFKSNQSGKNVTTNRYGISAPVHLIVNDPEIGVKSYEGLPLTAFFPDPSSTMIARTGWDEGVSTDVVAVKMKAGQRNFENHQHADSGHFDIYYKGQLLLDSGIYNSAPFSRNGVPETKLNYSSLHDRNYHKRTIAHNCMLIYDPNETGSWYYSTVNDGGQRREDIPYTFEELMTDPFDFGKAIAYNFGPDIRKPAYSYIKGDIANAYSSHKLENYERTFFFLNFFDETYPAALIVFDNVKSTSADFKKSFLMHCMEEPVVNGNVSIIERTKNLFNGRLVTETLLPEKTVITKIGGPGREFEVNGYNEMAVNTTPYQESGNWRLEISPANRNKQDYFLNVMQIGEADENIAPLKTELLMNNDDYVGVMIKDRAVFIRKPKSKMYKKFTVSAPKSEENIMYIVNGLKAGKWEVLKDGKVITSCFTGEMEDSISFEGKGGEYTLRWVYSSEQPDLTRDFVKDMVDVTDHEPIDIKIGSRFETFKERPFTENDILFNDAEELFDKLKFEYEKNENSITVSVLDKKTTFTADSDIATVVSPDGTKEVTLEAKVKKVDGRIKIPLVNIAKEIALKVTWFDYAKCAFISKSGVPSDEDKERIYVPTEPGRLEIVDAVWSTHNESSDGYSALDNSLGTYWAASGPGEWIEFTLAEESEISSVHIAWISGDVRKEKFTIEVSCDGENYTKVFDGESNGKTKDPEAHKMPKGTRAKYIRVVGYCNTVNDWNSLSEIAVYK